MGTHIIRASIPKSTKGNTIINSKITPKIKSGIIAIKVKKSKIDVIFICPPYLKYS